MKLRLPRRTLARVVIAWWAAAVPALSAGGEPPALIPRPSSLEVGEGSWALRPTARVVHDGRSVEEAHRLSAALSEPLGRRLPVEGGPAREVDIALEMLPARAELGDEGYELRIGPEGVRIAARRPAGLFYGGVTLRQLLPEAAWRKAPSGETAWVAPHVRIVDAPRFGWRGILLDPARHFIAKAELLLWIDAMALHKLNRLQLHLTDDQGWRMPIDAFPRLTGRSSWRDGTASGHSSEQPERPSSFPHRGSYSKDDLREVIAYAAARHIVVVPEIEMPGHAGAWLSAYPEFAVFPDRAGRLEVSRRWGISKDVLAPRPSTLEACKRILDEVCEVFPSPWIHIGGDEAPRDQWKESSEMQELIRSLGLADEDALQAWFTAELSRHLSARGRRLVGWDEILAGARLGGSSGATSPSPDAVVMSWRGEQGGRSAARAGHDVVMAPNEWTYLDYYQGPPGEEPIGIGGSIGIARAYAYEPLPPDLPEEAARRVLGAQAQVWGEYLPSFEAAGAAMFPRACALAEAFWSPAGRDLAGFLRRLERHEARLRATGIPHRPLARRTCFPDASGRIVASARDVTIHGTEVTRRPDGALAGWKDPFTVLAWRVEIPTAGRYRVRVLLAGTGAPGGGWMEAVIAGRALRAAIPGSSGTADLGVFETERPGPLILFLRAGGTPGPDGFAVVAGVEIEPAGVPR